MSSINLLNISRDALLSHQTAIDLTGTNIANVNTPGYTRQRPVFKSLGYIDSVSGQVQVGVEVDSIERVYDKFIDNQLMEKTSDVSYYEARHDMLERVEIFFNDTGDDGLDTLLSEFWNSWEALSANPEGDVERTSLVANTESMTDLFHSYSENLQSAVDDANTEISELVDEANVYIENIAEWNDKIAQVKSTQGNTNDLVDKRAEELKKLAEIIDFNYIETDDGLVNVYLSDGRYVIEGANSRALAVEVNTDNSSYYDVVFADGSGEVSIDSGRISALLELRDTTLSGYISDLDTLASALVSEVNSLHQTGYDQNNNVGGVFFDSTGTSASTIEIDADLASDISMIAASETLNGDGAIAGSISSLKDQNIVNGTMTANNYNTAFVARIGRDVSDSARDHEHNSALMEQLTTRREQVSGVSIDEEMINLTKYQLGYNAAAKLCSIVEELTDTLLSLI